MNVPFRRLSSPSTGRFRVKAGRRRLKRSVGRYRRAAPIPAGTTPVDREFVTKCDIYQRRRTAHTLNSLRPLFTSDLLASIDARWAIRRPSYSGLDPVQRIGRRVVGRRACGRDQLGGRATRRRHDPPRESYQIAMKRTDHDWTPMESSTAGARCRNCGTHVTQQFARVFGDNGDVVHGCPACTTYREMQSGGHLPSD